MMYAHTHLHVGSRLVFAQSQRDDCRHDLRQYIDVSNMAGDRIEVGVQPNYLPRRARIVAARALRVCGCDRRAVPE